MKGYLVNISFEGRVADADQKSIAPLVNNFNRQNDTNITWMGNLNTSSLPKYIRLSGADADMTRQCATLIAGQMDVRQSSKPDVGPTISTRFLVVH